MNCLAKRDKCIEDLKEGRPLEPDYSFVRNYYIDVKNDTITITAVVDDALVGITPASKTQDSKEWFVYDAINGRKTI